MRAGGGSASLGQNFYVTVGQGAAPVDYTRPMMKRGPIGPDTGADAGTVQSNSTVKQGG